MNARPQPRLQPCRHCGAASFHRIDPVREHGRAGDPAPMAVAWLERQRDLGPFARAVSCVGPRTESRPFGTFSVVVCTGCGDARWYAHDLDVDLPCATLGLCECGEQRGSRVSVAQTRGAGGEPSPLRVAHFQTRRWGFTSSTSGGSFSTFPCHGCGLTTWFAAGLDTVPLSSTPAPPCHRCNHGQRFIVDPVNEDGATLRVLYDRVHMKDVRIGTYALSICAGCGVTDWTARDFAALTQRALPGVSMFEAEGGRGALPMKKTLTCPKCEGRTVWHIAHVRGQAIDLKMVSFLGIPGASPKAIGTFEAFICKACGYTEHYAHGIEQLVERPGEVTLIDNEPNATLR